MAVSNGQGLATGPILLGDVGQIFKLGINGHTNTQIRCTQIGQCKDLAKLSLTIAVSIELFEIFNGFK